METLNTEFQTQTKIIYGTKEFGDLVIQVSNYGVDIVKPNEKFVGGFEQLCFLTDLEDVINYLLECKLKKDNPTSNTIIYKEGIDNVSYSEGEVKEFTYGTQINE